MERITIFYYNYNTVIFSSNFIKNICGRYACTVVAMLSVCAQEGYFQLRNSNGAYNTTNVRQAFNRLWELSGTSVCGMEGTIQLGTTSRYNVVRAIEDFCSIMTNTIIRAALLENPSWNDIVRHVGQGQSTIFGVHINIEENGIIEDSGHAVNVVGYTTYRENSTGKVLKYLNIGDGWSDIPRFFIFDTSKFNSSYIVYV